MTLMQIRITSRPAIDIINDLRRLKKQKGRTRWVTWFRKWTRLRRELSETHEYITFRQAVLGRDNFTCSCGAHATQVHHKIEVSTFPLYAIVVSNGQAICDLCHKKHHPWMRIRSNANRSANADRRHSQLSVSG